MAEVKLNNVHKRYPGRIDAVRDLSLHVRSGELLVLVGPSGCGKSTTLRMIAGLESVTQGSIEIAGRVVNNVHPKDRDIAMVFQNYALYPHMTVRANMAFALRLRRLARDEVRRRVDDAARTLGIDSLLDRRPAQLSGGQKQRVALGRAIVREPKAFLFDEPLSNLDARLRVATRAELKALHLRLRTTTVYVTHDQEEAMTLGDRIAVLAAGQLHQVGPPLEVYRAPANRFVAGFIGTPPMNFLDGSLDRDGDHAAFVERGGSVRIPLQRPPSRAAGSPVVLGVRPTALQIDDRGPISVIVSVVEPLGESMDLHGSTPGGQAIVARVRARDDLRPGAALRLAIDADRAHLFEPGEFGARIDHQAP